MKEIAASIRSLRLARAMTQAQLAEKLGVQYQTISKWETSVSAPDAAMLPAIADTFGVTIDELFGRRLWGCSRSLDASDTEFVLQTYARMYAPEAGPWNLSVPNKYLEYRLADFFAQHFQIPEGAKICNIGIGAGEWDHYLSYQLDHGSLTSIDRLEACCRQLEKRLICEENPNSVTVLCADAMTLELTGQFDIVTMVGTTGIESENALALLIHAFRFVKRGGAFYYQSMDQDEDHSAVIRAAFGQSMTLGAFQEDEAYGFHCRYYQFEKPHEQNDF